MHHRYYQMMFVIKSLNIVRILKILLYQQYVRVSWRLQRMSHPFDWFTEKLIMKTPRRNGIMELWKNIIMEKHTNVMHATTL